MYRFGERASKVPGGEGVLSEEVLYDNVCDINHHLKDSNEYWNMLNCE